MALFASANPHACRNMCGWALNPRWRGSSSVPYRGWRHAIRAILSDELKRVAARSDNLDQRGHPQGLRMCEFRSFCTQYPLQSQVQSRDAQADRQVVVEWGGVRPGCARASGRGYSTQPLANELDRLKRRAQFALLLARPPPPRAMRRNNRREAREPCATDNSYPATKRSGAAGC
jgi:hypothetical protein